MNPTTNSAQLDRIKTFFNNLESCESNQFMEIVESQTSDSVIELMCDHIEDFYGIQDDEEIGMLAQIMVTGFLLGKNESTPVSFITEAKQQ